LYEEKDSNENCSANINSEPTLKRKLIVGKMLVDRWDNIVTDILIHRSKVKYLFNNLSNEYSSDVFYKNEERMLDQGIWGASISYTDDIPEDKVLMVSLNEYGNLSGGVPSRAVASFSI
jgi:hypothetical protein